MKNKLTSQVPQYTVDAWLNKAKTSFGIRSIICLLDEQQVRLYAALKVDLISYCWENGFHIEHIPVRNQQHPALSDRQLEEVWRAYKRLEKPVLIHGSAGIGHTGKAAPYIKRELKNVTPSNICVSSECGPPGKSPMQLERKASKTSM